MPAAPRTHDGPDRQWGLRLVACLALVVALGYLGWRVTATLNLSVWWVSIPLWLLEFHAIVAFALFVFTAWDVQGLAPAAPVRHPPGRVAVLVPTYNESFEVLLPTVSAAVAIRLEHETWLLDDGNRPWVRDMADELGVRYLARTVRTFAKAGNLNAALEQIEADFVVVLDADHVAAPDFLTHTLGYFSDTRVAMVQTPQDFYNNDSFEHDDSVGTFRRGDRRTYCEQGLFYRVLQPGRNRWNAAFSCGSNSVFRARALREVGGFAVESITEDIHTSLRLHRRGWRTAYHNEVLARGLAAADGQQYLAQRLRWGTGAMQVLRLERPLTGPGLTLPQRLSYAATLTGWFDSWRTLGYLLMPILVLLTGASPIRTDVTTFTLAFASAFLLQQWATSLLSRGRGSFVRAMLFEVVRMPANLAATLTLLSSRELVFQVTTKGRLGQERQRIPVPRLHAALLALGAISALWFALSITGLTPLHYGATAPVIASAGWLALNMTVLVIAIRRIRATRHASERRAAYRFTLSADVQLDGRPVELVDLSLTGARVTAPSGTAVGASPLLRLHLGEVPIDLDVLIGASTTVGARVQLAVEFLPGQLPARTALARQLFLRLSAPEPGAVGYVIAPSEDVRIPHPVRG